MTSAIFHRAFVDIRATSLSHAISFVARMTSAVIHSGIIVAGGVKQLTASVVYQTLVDVLASVLTYGYTPVTFVAGASIGPDGIIASCILVTCLVVFLTFVDIDAVDSISTETDFTRAISRSFGIGADSMGVTTTIIRFAFVNIDAPRWSKTIAMVPVETLAIS